MKCYVLSTYCTLWLTRKKHSADVIYGMRIKNFIGSFVVYTFGETVALSLIVRVYKWRNTYWRTRHIIYLYSIETLKASVVVSNVCYACQKCVNFGRCEMFATIKRGWLNLFSFRSLEINKNKINFRETSRRNCVALNLFR